MIRSNNLKKTLIIVIILLCVHLNSNFEVISASEEKGAWEIENLMPTDRVGHGVVSCNGKIYVIGGYNKSGFLNSTESYDPINGTWETKTPMPYERAEFGICAVGNLIYVMGGCHTLRGKFDYMYPSNVLNSVIVYNTEFDNWTFKSPMPTGRISLDLCNVDNKIYAIGGARLLWNDCCFYFYNPNGANEVYNPLNDSWEILPDMINPRHHLGVANIGDGIFACGGNKGSDMWPPENIVEKYSITKKTWETLSPLPLKLAGFGISTFDDKIYTFGGLGYPIYHTDVVFEYNPINDEWNNISSMPTIRYGAEACNFKDKIYVFGGAIDGVRSIYTDKNTYLKTVEEFILPTSNLSYKPYVTIVFPEEKSNLERSFEIKGTASSPQGLIENVQIKIDSNSWFSVNGTNKWDFQLNSSFLSNGNHSIYARSFDGLFFSDIEEINISFKNLEINDDNIEKNETSGFEIIFTFLSIILILLSKKRKK